MYARAGFMTVLVLAFLPPTIFGILFIRFFDGYDWQATECEHRVDSWMIPIFFMAVYFTSEFWAF